MNSHKKMLTLGLALATVCSLMLPGCGAGEAASNTTLHKQTENRSSVAANNSQNKKIKIGMTLYSLKNEFTVRLANAAEKKAKALGIDLMVYDGNYDPSTQISQIETMISDGVNGIILNPQDAQACSPCVDKAIAAGLPIVGVNTRVKNDKLTSYVGSKDITAGEMEMNTIADKIGGKGNIVILEGPMGQSAQLERREGIQNILNKYPNIKILADKTANWSRSEGMTVMENWLNAFDKIDAIVAENDEMALGALEACKAANRKAAVAVGVDGITDALHAIKSGELLASMFQDASAQGSKAVEICSDAINKKPIEKDYWIDFEKITSDNVDQYTKRAQ